MQVQDVWVVDDTTNHTRTLTVANLSCRRRKNGRWEVCADAARRDGLKSKEEAGKKEHKNGHIDGWEMELGNKHL